jgi:Flp pilus assembly protein TadD
LIPLLEKGSDTRDLGLAYYELVVQRDTSRKAIATSLLSGLTNSSSQPDIPALRALGVLAEMNGRKPDAERLYREVLKSDPNDLTANTNLGTLLAQRGDLLGAELQWKDLFNRNEDQVLLGRNLAVVQCLLGEGDIAKKTLETALIYSPDDPGALRTLQSILNGEQKCSVAASK